MLNTIFATKLEMSQAWSKEGKRLPITKLQVADNLVVGSKQVQASSKFNDQMKRQDCQILEIGYGRKKLKNMKKPLLAQLKKSGFSFGVKKITGVQSYEAADSLPQVGQTLQLSDVLAVGDVVEVQGESKGRGFAGAVKRYGFHGGPKTHGQSDRHRAVGSIGSGTTPGRVWKGKRMPGHMGTETKTIKNLVVVFIDEANDIVWLNGPVPGFRSATVRINKTGEKREINLDPTSLPVQPKTAEVKEELVAEETNSAAVVEEKVEEKTEEKIESKAEEKADKAETNKE